MTDFPKLPFDVNVESHDVLRLLNQANERVGELRGMYHLLPDSRLLLNILKLKESQDSSVVENIMTTFDDIHRELATGKGIHPGTKEVLNYKKAMEEGFEALRSHGFISTNMLVDIQAVIEPRKSGIRNLPGTKIVNEKTKEVVHTPPQDEKTIRDLLDNLEDYMNNDSRHDPLIDMALIHFQFESIHPFFDGNGRTGRILASLYLVMKEKLPAPILYLSAYIVANKDDYYRLLKLCNEDLTRLDAFVLYMLQGVKETAETTIRIINDVSRMLKETKDILKSELPKLPYTEISEHVFRNIHTKNAFFREDMDVSKNTATKYLKELVRIGVLIEEKIGKEKIYKNARLLEYLT